MFHEESFILAENIQLAGIGNFVKRPNVSGKLTENPENMKTFLIFLLASIVQFSYSQETKVSRNELINSFKKTIIQIKKGIIQTDSNPWFADNTNDNYFKKDTIVLINARSFKREFCKVINWNFYKETAFTIGYADYCSEPPTQKVNMLKDWIELKVYDFKGNLLIELFNQDKLVEKFKIISFEKKQSLYDKAEFEYILRIVRMAN